MVYPFHETADDVQLEQPPWVVDSCAELDHDLIDAATWSRSPGLWMVAFYLVLFIIRPWEVLMPWLGDLRFERIYAITMILVVAMTGRLWKWTWQCWTVSAFAATVVMSAVFAFQSSLSWEPLYRYLTVVVTYFLLMAVMKSTSDVYLLILAYIGAMWTYLGKSMWEFFVHNRHEYAQGVPRLLGTDLTFGEPNAVAMSTVVSLPLWYFLWRNRHTLFFEWNRTWRRLGMALVVTYPVMAFVATLLTNSRAGMVGIGAFAVLAVVRNGSPIRWIRTSFIMLALLAAMWIFSPQQQKDRLRTLWDKSAGPYNAHESADGRWEGFVAAMQMFQRFPATGVGVGNFVLYRRAFLDGDPRVAHNLPGQILGETGVLGGIAFTLMTLATWSICWKLQRSTVGEEDPIIVSYYDLSYAISNTILLMLLFGLSLHNGLRFNWLWIAAFAVAAQQQFDRRLAMITSDVMDDWDSEY